MALPMHRSPSMSVVAPTYHRRQALERFVEPLLADDAVDELVMAVDGSDDGSVQWLSARAARDPRLVVLDLPNRGAGATRQAGIEAARGDVVLLLDDDVIASPGLVTGHARHHCDGERKLVLGYMPNSWEALPAGRRGIARIYRRAYESHVEKYVEDPLFVLHGFWGGNFSMPRRDFLEVGMEQLAVKRGQDDREFGIRCLKAGIRGVFDPSLSATHEYSRSLAQFRGDMRLQGQSRQLIHEEHADLLGVELVEHAHDSEVEDAVGLGVPRALRRCLPLLAHEPAFIILTEFLTMLFAAGVRLGALELEVFAARGIGSLETQRGVLDRIYVRMNDPASRN